MSHKGQGPGRLHGIRCANKWHPYAMSLGSSESSQPQRGVGGFNWQIICTLNPPTARKRSKTFAANVLLRSCKTVEYGESEHLR